MTKRITLLAIAIGVLGACNNGNATVDAASPGNDMGQVTPHDMGVTQPDTGGMTPDSGPAIDMGSDAGCTSTMPHCNTCTTPATDPLNACSSYVGNCTPFDNAARVPGWPDHIPQVM